MFSHVFIGSADFERAGTPRLRAGERGIHALLAGVFGHAGLRLLLSRSINTRP